MLIGLDPLLGADLLHALASMGHGDTIAIVDANFPATTMGRRVVDVRGANAPRVLDAVLSVLPVDTFVAPAIFTMEVVGDAAAVPAPVTDFLTVLNARGLAVCDVGKLERDAFYARARDAFVIVRTGEPRAYGNILLVKGVVAPRPI